MILLLSGTAETAPLTRALAETGHSVLVSMATDVRLDIGKHPRVRQRSGPLNEEGMAAVICAEAIRFIADATHPYATIAHLTARSVATRFHIPYLALIRAPGLADNGEALHAPDHETAARIAFDLGRPVWLTIGSRNLEPYARAAREQSLPLVARVLNHPDSLAACRRAGLDEGSVIVGRGPFSFRQNREIIRRFHIGVVVTKESGEAGGVAAKAKAAAAEGCSLVVVDRPGYTVGPAVATIAEMVRTVKAALGASGLTVKSHLESTE